MQQEFQKHIQEQLPELLKGKLLIAVSGGIDSMVLLHLCHRFGLECVVAHCNFHLREEESNEDQRFVEKVCRELCLPYFVKEFDTTSYAKQHKLSIQLAARKLRYDWFDELLQKEHIDYLLTAHHLDDAAETFLINFTRGTGIKGLLGIPEKNECVRRPLLPFSRQEIKAFAQEQQIRWREDHTNAETKYFRNKIRKDILPILKQYNTGFDQSFTKTIKHLNEIYSMAEEAAQILYQEVVKKRGEQLFFSISELYKSKNYEGYLYHWLAPYGFTSWTDVTKLLQAKSGKKIYSSDYVLLKDRESLILAPKYILAPKDKVYYLGENELLTKPITIRNERIKYAEETKDSLTILVDRDTLQFPLELRRWKTGDSFRPIGMKGTKKLSKYFKDQKFSQIQKENTWLLCSNNEIVWVVGSRMDDRFKITDTTKTILKISVKQ